MRVLIVSDSHGLTEELHTIKNRHKDVNAFVHCGDSELQADSREMEGFLAVRGNCDYDERYENEETLNIGEDLLYVTHGHLYNVKMTLMNLTYRAKERDAKVVCFGHSHIAGAEKIDQTLFINPGSIRLPNRRKERTYAILQYEENKATVNFYDHEGNEIKDLTNSFSL
ncbi:metallophosphoesterase family protein [Priestia endophytica]|uniref:metallophosphoesterase family protein n=1 Tax=Priestia endophytica TaxID=135735 RepID=UPI00228069F2|nr:metallophosphoesterase [Priestia endophytica]MCY8233701.1 metallophosphoesterase [Priestia endophytica]